MNLPKLLKIVVKDKEKTLELPLPDKQQTKKSIILLEDCSNCATIEILKDEWVCNLTVYYLVHSLGL